MWPILSSGARVPVLDGLKERLKSTTTRGFLRTNTLPYYPAAGSFVSFAKGDAHSRSDLYL